MNNHATLPGVKTGHGHGEMTKGFLVLAAAYHCDNCKKPLSAGTTVMTFTVNGKRRTSVACSEACEDGASEVAQHRAVAGVDEIPKFEGGGH